jgi:phage/plasmid-associated DNA primase
MDTQNSPPFEEPPPLSAYEQSKEIAPQVTIVPFSLVPLYLKKFPQWVNWRYERRGNSSKPTKPPYSPTTHKRARTNDLSTCVDFDTACGAAQKVNGHHYDGIGFVFSQNDGITGIDVDLKNTEKEKEFNELKSHLLSRFNSTYCETSPSGIGFHILVKGASPVFGKKAKLFGGGVELEIYDYRSPRYFTVTGNHIPDTATDITEQQKALDWVCEKYFSEKEKSPAKNSEIPNKATSQNSTQNDLLNDDDVLRICRKARNKAKFEALWSGGGDDDLSRGDFALCGMLAFYTQSPAGQGESQIDRLFRQSGRMREKWDERHGQQTYGELTIAKAIKGCTKTYTPKAKLNKPKAPAKSQTKTTTNNKYYKTTYTENGGEKHSLVQQSQARKIFLNNGDADGLAYNSITEDWYRYKNGVWQCVSKDVVMNRLDKTIEKCINEVDLGFTHNWINGVFKLLQTPLATEDWDKQPSYLIPFKNGILNLQSMELTTHNADYRFTWQLPYEYQPQATCQPIINWLYESVKDDENQVQVLRAYLQAVLTGRFDLERYLEIIGEGGSGKSTFAWLCQALVGTANTRATDFKTLESNRFEMSSFYGKRLIILSDESKFAGNVDNFKKITGGDSLRYEDKHKSVRGDKSRDFVFQGMCLVIANQAIKSSDYTSGLARRRLTLYFNNSPSKIRNLKGENGEFKPLLPGLVNWVLAMPIADAEYFLREGDKKINSLITTRLDNLENTNPLFGWLNDNCIYDSDGFTPTGGKKLIRVSEGEKTEDGSNSRSHSEYQNQNTELYPNYCMWCDSQGKKTVSLNDFAKLLEDLCQRQLGLKNIEKKQKRINNNRFRGFNGIILNSEISFAESANLIVDDIEDELEI